MGIGTAGTGAAIGLAPQRLFDSALERTDSIYNNERKETDTIYSRNSAFKRHNHEKWP